MRNISRFILGTAIFFFLASGTWASVTYDDWSHYPSSPVSGGQHFYSVFLRGNGEAIVGAKLIFENEKETPQETFSFKVNSSVPDEITVFQELRRCKMGYYTNCKESETPDYARDAYPYDVSFARVDHGIRGQTIKVTLTEPVPANGQGAIMLRYRSFVHTSKQRFGRRQVNFQTFKVDHELKQVQVAVSVDQDLFLKERTASVQYRETREAATTLGFAADTGLSVSSQSLKQFSNFLTRGGQLTKTAKELAKEESYTVKATYASSRLGLYWDRVALILLGFLVIILGLVALYRYRVKKGASSGLMSPARLMSPMVGSVLFGLMTVVILVGTIIGGGLILPRLDRLFWGEGILEFLFGITAFLIAVTLFFAPSVYYGYRYGRKYGLLSFLFAVLWLVVLLVAAALIFGGSAPNYRDPFYID